MEKEIPVRIILTINLVGHADILQLLSHSSINKHIIQHNSFDERKQRNKQVIIRAEKRELNVY